ncbi:MAG: tol-pal system protein YbgF [Syntrophales bacterium]|nr:tol-pal system protein YbgF [Syntrophales bacterium]MDD5531570.1 tol-pal system protein YbgF [Syntrophales bacterium]HPL63183.1 tol-pal system protein YbgF [Syntrophales bacterium]
MNKIRIGFLSALLVCLVSCATTDELKKVQGGLDHRVLELRESLAKIEQNLEETRESVKALRKFQADTGADMIEIRDALRNMKGAVEELRKELASSKTRDARLNELAFRINFLENFLGVNKKGEGHLETGDKQSEKANGPVKNGKASREAVYSSAQKAFKEGRYEDSRKEFQRFLELFPKAEYSDNAQFWIGECYYAEGKFEKAILEYEKLIKGFSGSDKLPHALLKQGLSFQKLGDKSSAKLLLQRVIRDHPNSNQARIAKARLAEMK